MGKFRPKFDVESGVVRLLTKHFGWSCLVFFLLILMQGAFLFWLSDCNSPERTAQFLSVKTGDHDSYIVSIVNFFREGSYYFLNAWDEPVYAGRIPFYGLIYYLLDVVSFGHGFTMLSLLQLGVEAFSVCFLARHFALSKKTERVGVLFLAVMLVSAAHTWWSIKVQPESLATSLLIVLAALFLKNDRRPATALLIGVLILLLTSFKPYLGVLLIPFILLIIRDRERLLKMFFRLVGIGIPLFLFMVIWGVRNFQVMGEPVVLTESYSGYPYTESELALRSVGARTGLGMQPWNDTSFGHFMTEADSPYEVPGFLKESMHYEHLLEIREAYIDFRQHHERNPEMDRQLAAEIADYEDKLAAELPFRVGLLGPVRHMKLFLVSSGSWYYPVTFRDRVCGNFLADVDKLLQSFLYFITLLLLVPGLFVMYKNGHKRLAFFIIFLVGFLMLFFPYVLGYVEVRYFIQTYPFCVLGMVYLLGRGSDLKGWGLNARR